MINTKKIIALGLIAATGASMIATTTASAAPATAGGTTTVSYEPGKSTGGDQEGNVADWTVDYPISMTLEDSNTSAQTSKEMKFKLVNSSDKTTDYSGEKVVKLKLKQMTTGTEGKNILLKNGDSQAKMGLTTNKNDQLDITSISTKDIDVASMQKKQNTGNQNVATVGAYLTDKGSATKGKNYSASLTWVFSSEN